MLIQENDRSGSGRKYCLAVIDAGYFLTRELVQALGAEGHRVVVLPFKMPPDAFLHDPKIYSRFMQTVITVCEKHKPDALISINHLVFDAEGRLTELLESLNLPGLIWYVDSPRYIFLNHRFNVSDWIGIFLWDPSYSEWLRGIGFDHIAELPLATDPDIFQLKPVYSSELSGFDSQSLAFVGDSMSFAVDRAMKKLPPNLSSLLLTDSHAEPTELALRFCSELMSAPTNQRLTGWNILKPFLTELPVACKTSNLDQTTLLNLESSLVLLATKLQRAEILGKVTKADSVDRLTIFGDENWRKVLDGSTQFFPGVDYYTELPKLYNQAGAVINLTSFQMPYGLNQRCYDVPAAGGFLLTDHQAAIEDQFDPDHDVVCFDGAEDLIDKWTFYKNHPVERRTRIERTRCRVLDQHTYRHRVRKMLELASDWFWR